MLIGCVNAIEQLHLPLNRNTPFSRTDGRTAHRSVTRRRLPSAVKTSVLLLHLLHLLRTLNTATLHKPLPQHTQHNTSQQAVSFGQIRERLFKHNSEPRACYNL